VNFISCTSEIHLARELKAALPSLENSTLTIIPTFNNPTYTQQMINQCRSYGLKSLVILDGGSTYLPMRTLLSNLSKDFLVIDLPYNPGPRLVIQSDTILENLPKNFVITDPDLKFNEKLPVDFLASLQIISSDLNLGKVGFALDISQPNNMRLDKFTINEKMYTIVEWELQFWTNRINYQLPFEIYEAAIDTTFAFYNQDFYKSKNFQEAHRVAGDFTATHLPWMRDTDVPQPEMKFYESTQKWSYYSLR
jgi:hypothetical protein